MSIKPQKAQAVAPALWNPKAAIAWGLLFTPILGSLVQANNWQVLNRPLEAMRALNWAAGCAAALLVAVVAEPVCQHVPAMQWAKLAVMVVSWILWVAFEARRQPEELAAIAYTPKGWGPVVLIGCLGGVVFSMVGILVGMFMKIFGLG